jgi:hypothetical protein
MQTRVYKKNDVQLSNVNLWHLHGMLVVYTHIQYMEQKKKLQKENIQEL